MFCPVILVCFMQSLIIYEICSIFGNLISLENCISCFVDKKNFRTVLWKLSDKGFGVMLFHTASLWRIWPSEILIVQAAEDMELVIISSFDDNCTINNKMLWNTVSNNCVMRLMALCYRQWKWLVTLPWCKKWWETKTELWVIWRWVYQIQKKVFFSLSVTTWMLFWTPVVLCDWLNCESLSCPISYGHSPVFTKCTHSELTSTHWE